MAKIITTQNCKRRTIRLSSDDIISIVQEYQQVMRGSESELAKEVLSNKVFYIPEEV